MALSVPASDVSARLALDANALAGLKQQAKAAPDQALKAAASQFEALFMQMLLKSMRDALPQDGPLASDASRTYTGMLDAQLAQQLGKRGIGIADMLVKQLSRGLANAAGAGGASTPGGATPAAPTAKFGTTPATSPANPATPDAVGVPAGVVGGVRAFIDKLQPYAEAVGRAAGLPGAFLLAQAGLETGWGRFQPRGADGAPSHNIFGMKAGKSWTGPVVEAVTTEYVNGKPVTTLEKFRTYASYGEALQDFARLVSGNPRYAGVVANAGDAGAYAQGLQKAGYATDPRYAEKLTTAIRLVTRHTGGASASATAQLLAGNVDKQA
jgi:flagellar protein FlgJ